MLSLRSSGESGEVDWKGAALRRPSGFGGRGPQRYFLLVLSIAAHAFVTSATGSLFLSRTATRADPKLPQYASSSVAVGRAKPVLIAVAKPLSIGSLTVRVALAGMWPASSTKICSFCGWIIWSANWTARSAFGDASLM